MNILHHEQEKDGVCHHMKKEGILQLLFHRHLRLVNNSYLKFRLDSLKFTSPTSLSVLKWMLKIKLINISLKVCYDY
jgi:hypothetical protein